MTLPKRGKKKEKKKKKTHSCHLTMKQCPARRLIQKPTITKNEQHDVPS